MRRLFIAIALFVAVAAQGRDAAELQVALRKLTVVGGALYVAAHPDDENTAMLAWMANDRLLRTAYLSVTRGDGGQNLIGDEKGELLGVIRTQELLAARRVDGAEQLFTRAIDFGYSKSPEETLAIWGHDAVLADVVWAIRRFQPDVIITRFPVTGEGGHGQHTASAILAEEAFAAAADPKRFPRQLKYVTAWQPRRIFWNRFSWGRVDPNDPALANSLRVDLGKYSPLLGRAYTEIAAESRTLHKSQGFGSAERRGSLINYYDHRAGDPARADLFEGIDLSWSRYAGGDKVGALLQQAADSFDAKDPQKSLPVLLQAWKALEQLSADPEWSSVKKPWLAGKQLDLLHVIRDVAGIAIDVSAADSAVTPGGELPVTVTVVNRSDHPFRLSVVGSLHAKPSKAPGTPLENNKPVRTELTIRLPDDYEYSQPYWLRSSPESQGLYAVDDLALIGAPRNPPAIPLYVSLDDPTDTRLIFTVPTVYRWTDPVEGEQIREVDVVPEMTANPASGVYIFPRAEPRRVTLLLRSFGATETSVRLRLPDGWSAEPASRAVTFTGKGDEQRAEFVVTPPASPSTGQILAEAVMPGGKTIALGVTAIDYPHIPAQRVFGDAAAKLVRADIRRRGERIGYIMGSGDDVPDILRQVGYEVTLLTDADLDRGDFAQYDAIVAGIRAYNTRKRLRLAHDRLMEYIANGGTMVVQYNTQNALDDLAVPYPGPYPFKISRDRVTVENAPVTLVAPEHPVVAAPNRITAADFEGWVQERGLYFPNEWDSKYTTVISSGDPGESDKPGGQLVARHGKGVFIYTAYAWWRQLPAGVPGAIRAFVNLVSAR